MSDRIAYCPIHAAKMVVYSTKGRMQYLRCPDEECTQTSKRTVSTSQLTICHCGVTCYVASVEGAAIIMECPTCSERYRIPRPHGFTRFW